MLIVREIKIPKEYVSSKAFFLDMLPKMNIQCVYARDFHVFMLVAYESDDPGPPLESELVKREFVVAPFTNPKMDGFGSPNVGFQYDQPLRYIGGFNDDPLKINSQSPTATYHFFEVIKNPAQA